MKRLVLAAVCLAAFAMIVALGVFSPGVEPSAPPEKQPKATEGGAGASGDPAQSPRKDEVESAHLASGDVLVEGKWYPKEEADIARAAAGARLEHQDYDRLSPREKKLLEVRENLMGQWDQGEVEQAWMDCSPDTPFVICLEKSNIYDASRVLEEFRANAKAFYEQFTRQFGETFNSSSLCVDAVCPIYIFSTEARYRTCTFAPDYMGGHFNPVRGQSFLYRDTRSLYETLFHEFTHQVLHAIAALKTGPPATPPGTTTCWFREGITCYFEGFKRNAKGEIQFGVPAAEYLSSVKLLLSKPKHSSLEELMQITDSKFRVAGERKQAMQITAQSWSATYFLLTAGDGKYRDKYLAYFKLELAGKGGPEAAKKCFGDLGALNTEYEEYFRAMK